MKSRIKILLLCAAFVWAFLVVATFGDVKYSVEALGVSTPISPAFWPFNLNDAGQVVGFNNGVQPSPGVVWQNGITTDIAGWGRFCGAGFLLTPDQLTAGITEQISVPEPVAVWMLLGTLPMLRRIRRRGV